MTTGAPVAHVDVARRVGAPAVAGADSRRLGWTVAVLAALALGLRWALIHQSLFGDELFLYAEVHGKSLGQMFTAIHHEENTPPLFFLVTWVFAKGGNPMLLVRVPSLLASVATVPLAYVLGRRTLGTRAAIAGAAWLAISPFQIFYGTEDRAYAAVAMLVVVSTLALLAALASPRRREWWVLYAVAAIAAMYTHYVAVLVLGPQAAWALWTHRDSIRRQLVAQGSVVVALLPWIPWFLAQARHSSHESVRLSTLSPLTAANAARTELQSLLGHPYVFPGRLPGLAPLVVLAVLFGASAAALAYRSYRARGRVAPTRVALAGPGVLMALLAVSPILLIVLYSIRPHTSLLLPRNVIVGTPYAALVLGWLLTRWRGWVSAALTVAALAAVGVGTAKMLGTADQRPDGRAAARFIDARAPAGAPVIDFPGPQGTQFYFQRAHPVYTPAGFGSPQWAAAARRRTPVFVTFLAVGGFIGTDCPSSAPHYRLLAAGRWPGAPAPLVACELVPVG